MADQRVEPGHHTARFSTLYTLKLTSAHTENEPTLRLKSAKWI